MWSTLSPYPDGAGGEVVLTAFVLIVLLGGAAALQELRLALRALGLIRLMRSQKAVRSLRQVEELGQAIGSTSPPLEAPARRLIDTAFDQEGVVRFSGEALELFTLEDLRRSMLPASMVGGLPWLLVGIGACGGVIALVAGMEGGPFSEGVGASTALVALSWGMLGGVGLAGLSRLSGGISEVALWRLRGWLEGQLVAGGGDGSSIARLGRGQERLRRAIEQTGQSLKELVRLQTESAADQSASRASLEGLAGALGEQLSAAPSIASRAGAGMAEGALADQILAALDASVGQGFRDASEVMRDFSKTQGEALDRWSSASEEVSGILGQLRAASEEIRRSAGGIGDISQPLTAAAASFASTSAQMGVLVPDIARTSESYERARDALDRSAEVLVQGTAGYLKAGDTLQELTAELRQAQRAHGASLESWRGSVDAVGRLVGELDRVTGGFTDGMGRLGEVMAPAEQAAGAFLQASERMSEVLPSITGASESYERSREALDRSTEALLQGTTGYLKAGDTLQELTAELRQVQAANSSSATDWRSAVDTVSGMMGELRGVASAARDSAERLGGVMEPAERSAKTFLEASTRLGEVLPGIESTAESYAQSRQALESAAAALSLSTEGYQAAGELVGGLVGELRQLQTDQSSSLSDWRGSVDAMNSLMGALDTAATEVRQGIGGLTEVLPPLSAAAGTFQSVTTQLTEVLPGIAGASESYERSKQALDASSQTLIQSTEGYRAAGEQVGQMLIELRGVHTQAIERISAGVDEAVLGSMRQVGSELQGLLIQQQSSLSTWQISTEQLASVTVSMGTVAGQLGEAAGRIEETSAPTLAASAAFQEAAGSLNEVLPRIESMVRSQGEIEGALEAASAALAEGTTGYLQAGESARRMVEALESQHSAVLEQASTSVQQVFSEPMKKGAEQLATMLEQQRTHTDTWETILSELTPTLNALSQSTLGLDSLVGRFREAALPAAQAGEAFKEAAHKLTALFPQLESSADGYDRINQALATAAAELTRSGGSYLLAGDKMENLLREFQQTLKVQVLGTREFSGALDKASGFVQAIGPASERVERAAVGLHDASTRTEAVVSTVRDTVAIQDDAIVRMRDTADSVLQAMQRQSTHWGSFIGEMDRLQSMLTSSVDLLTDKLPHSIDHTLVSFDAALGEGVARLGGAIERLREAMDDLNERLEGIVTEGRR